MPLLQPAYIYSGPGADGKITLSFNPEALIGEPAELCKLLRWAANNIESDPWLNKQAKNADSTKPRRPARPLSRD